MDVVGTPIEGKTELRILVEVELKRDGSLGNIAKVWRWVHPPADKNCTVEVCALDSFRYPELLEKRLYKQNSPRNFPI